MKKIISMILVVMMCLSIVLTGIISAAEEKMPFTDVKESKWFYGAVQYVYTNGLMNGKSETKFAPNEVLTRAQFAKMLWSLAGEPATEANLDFADTKNTQWYAESLTWAVGAGIVNGYEEGGKKLFKPNKEIFRDELAKMLVTFLDYMDIEIVGEDIADPFPDKIQNWAKDFVEAVRLSGLMKGKDGGRFEAKATATRAEGATILMRMHPYVSGGDETTEPDVSDPETTEPDVSDPETTEPETTPPEETEPLVKVYPDDDWKSMDAPADDPTPENIGTVYSDETIGLMISEAMKVDDNGETVKIAGTGIHGGHEVKVARTRYGTFAIFVSGDNAQEGRTNDEMSFFEITANGTRRIFKDDFDHSNGSCVPNILQGENGILYIILMNEDWSKSSARLTVYTYDAKTDTYTKDVQYRKYDISPSKVHGYGYTQPVLDEQHGKIYAIYNGGDVPGYVAWFIYDIATGTWEDDCYTIELDWRICYANAYPDGNGGFLFVEQRDATTNALGQLLGIDRFIGIDGYLWDALVLVHVPDVHVEHADIKDIFMPDYEANDKRSNANHYGNGSTLLDSDGNFHVVYTQAYGNKANIYYAAYDNNLNEVRHSTIKFSNTKNSFAPAVVEAPDGTVYIIAVNTYMTMKEFQVELWEISDDMKTIKKVCAPQTVTLKGATGDDAQFEPKNIIVGSIRNGSDIDGYVPVVFFQPDDKGTYDYYYFSVKLPD
ncbi:MAG: S-layer homology domain-containing protein [Clostridia bacterium]|nr:S-layer homology domain-containing protein [Clostridia bacterium]